VRDVGAIISALFGMVSAITGSTAQAQHPLVLQKFSALNAATPQPPDEVLLAQVKLAAQRIYPENGRCLERGVTLVAAQPATADRYVSTEALYNRLRNAWTVTVRHQGCDPANVRYMVIEGLDGQMNTIRVNRGVSYAHDSLIGDTLPMVMIAADAKFSQAGVTCGGDAKARLGVIRIEKEEAGLQAAVFGVRYSGSWSEIWPIEKCGYVIDLPVSFTADGDGGAYYRVRVSPDLRPSQIGK